MPTFHYTTQEELEATIAAEYTDVDAKLLTYQVTEIVRRTATYTGQYGETAEMLTLPPGTELEWDVTFRGLGYIDPLRVCAVAIAEFMYSFEMWDGDSLCATGVVCMPQEGLRFTRVTIPEELWAKLVYTATVC